MVDPYLLPGLAPSNGLLRNGVVGACYVVLAVGFVSALAEAPEESVVDGADVERAGSEPALNAARSGGGATSAATANGTTAATVTRVVDGDTLDVRYPDGSTGTVTLRGVDAPALREERDPAAFEGVPNDGVGRLCLCDAARDATAFLASRVAGATVHLRTANASAGDDPAADDRTASGSTRRDDAGRLVATVDRDGESVALALVEAGHARVTDPPPEVAGQYEGAEERAQQAARGLWSCRTADDAAAAAR